ncbi:MAG: hypothetical protein QOH97_5287 [Actinoplanes sp.]|nr:hypothetical protein [Actinoplanes sp.]
MIMNQPQRIIRPERRCPGRQLVQRRTHGVEISSMIHRPARSPRLLRRQILQRPRDQTRMQETRPLLGKRRSQTKIDQRRPTRYPRQQNIARINILMHHTTAMHRGDHLRQIHRHRQQLDQTHRPSRQNRTQRHPTQIHQQKNINITISVSVDQPRDILQTRQPPQHRPLMTHPQLTISTTHLLTDHRIPTRRHHPRHQRTITIVQHLHRITAHPATTNRPVTGHHHHHPASPYIPGTGYPLTRRYGITPSKHRSTYRNGNFDASLPTPPPLAANLLRAANIRPAGGPGPVRRPGRSASTGPSRSRRWSGRGTAPDRRRRPE